MRRKFFVCLALLCLANTPLYALSTTEILHIAANPTWLRLLHMPDTGGESRISSSSFFISKIGQTDAYAELQATLSAMRQPMNKEADQHAICRYPARYAFLTKIKAISQSNVHCPQLSQYLRNQQYTGASFLFAEGYLNNPGSVFGHMFFRLKRGENHSYLLDPVLNFTADTANDDGAVQMYKGLTGSYTGTFNQVPLYERMNHHNLKENRNVWEYPLKLNDEQLELLLLHFWEIKTLGFDYYFMSDNCVTQLLALVNVTVPKLDILRQSGYKIMPFQSLSLLSQYSDLLDEPIFHPSPKQQIRYRESLLPQEVLTTVKRLTATQSISQAKSLLLTVSPTYQAKVLDLSIDLLSNENQLSPTRQKYKKELVTYRSQLNVKSHWPPIPSPKNKPNHAHGSSRLSFGYQYDGADWFSTLAGRFVYHDFLDPSGANQFGSEVEMHHAEIAYRDSDVFLRQYELINITGLYPRTTLLKPKSHRLRFGYTNFLNNSQSADVYGLMSRGLTWGTESFLAYALADMQTNIGQQWHKGWRIAIGSSLGVLYRANRHWAIHAEVKRSFSLGNNRPHQSNWLLRHQWSFSKNFGLRFTINSHGSDTAKTTGEIAAQWYW